MPKIAMSEGQIREKLTEKLRGEGIHDLDGFVRRASENAQRRISQDDLGPDELWALYRDDKWVAMGPNVIKPQS
jgi:hypothetical protein